MKNIGNKSFQSLLQKLLHFARHFVDPKRAKVGPHILPLGLPSHPWGYQSLTFLPSRSAPSVRSSSSCCNYPKRPGAMLLHYIRGPNRLVTIYCTINCRLVALQRQWYTHYRGGGPLLHRGAEFGRSSRETCWRKNFSFCNFKFYSMKAEPSPTC